MFILFAIISIILDICFAWTGLFMPIGIIYLSEYGFDLSQFIWMFGPGCLGIVLFIFLFDLFKKMLRLGKIQGGFFIGKNIILCFLLILPTIMGTIYLLIDYWCVWLVDDHLIVLLSMLICLSVKLVGIGIIWNKWTGVKK